MYFIDKKEIVSSYAKKLAISFSFNVSFINNPSAILRKIFSCSNKVVFVSSLPDDTKVNWSDIIFNALTIKGITGRRMWAINVTGNVSSRSTEKMLYLDTKDGTMEIKLDSVRSLNNCKVLLANKKITVSCAIGSDEYWHAMDITT